MDTDSSSLPPPAYSEAVDYHAENELLKPTTLVLTGQTIHAESDPSNPLYQVNRGIATLGHATNTVEFERVDHVVRTTLSDDGTSTTHIRPRPRLLCNLKHTKVSDALGSHLVVSVTFYVVPVSKKWSLGSIGLLPVKLHWGKNAIHVVGVNTKDATEIASPTVAKNAQPLFRIQYNGNCYKWTDGQGNDIAMEYETCRLVITAALPQEMRDALVALWCCRIWQHSAMVQEGTAPKNKNKSFFLKNSEVNKMYRTGFN